MNIKTDVMGTKIHNLQRVTSEKIKEVTERLSTGLRINSASDDSAGLSISTRLQSQIRELKQSQNNIKDGISVNRTIDGNLETIQDMLVRAKELSIQAQNGTYSTQDKAAIQKEFQQILEQIDNTAEKANFNGINLLQAGSGLKFDSSSAEYLNIGPQTELQPPEYTLETWFNTASEAKQYIYRSRLYGFGLQVVNGNLSLGMYSNDAPTTLVNITTSETFNDGLWHRASITYDQNEIKMYVDNRLVGSAPLNGPVYYVPSGVGIGRDADSPNSYFEGMIGEVRLWDRALTKEEIDQNADVDVTGDTNLIGYWELDNISGGNVLDKTTNGNDAAIMGTLELIQKGDPSIRIHTGGENGNIQINKGYINSEVLNLKNLNIDDPNSLQEIDNALNKISSQRSYYGTVTNRLNYKLDNSENTLINTNKSLSRINDADFALESSNLLKEQIKLQTSMSMLQKNNDNRENSLSLLGG